MLWLELGNNQPGEKPVFKNEKWEKENCLSDYLVDKIIMKKKKSSLNLKIKYKNNYSTELTYIFLI